MTDPMMGIAATQRMQPLPDQGTPQVSKPGESKFDAVLADKAGKTQAVPASEAVKPVESVAKPEHATLKLVSHVVSELEQGQDAWTR